MVRSLQAVVAGLAGRRAVKIALVTALAATSGAWVFQRGTAAGSPRASHHPLGDRLPAVPLRGVDGTSTTLQDRLGHRPAVLYVFSAAQCAGCSNLALEFRILREAFPNVQPLVIGSGSDVETFRPYFEQMGVPDAALVDESRALLRGLDVTREPVVLLTDSTGRILLVDPRSASQAAQYPMGRILADLRGALDAPPHTKETTK